MKFLQPFLAAVTVGLLFISAGCSNSADQPIPTQQQTQQPTTQDKEQKYKITIDSPDLTKPVQSPLIVHGKVSGLYFFEGTFPVQLTDEQGNVIAEAVAHTDVYWMTESQVPFTVKIDYMVADLTPAKLVMNKDNPSGMPENDFSQSFAVTLN